MRLKYIAVRYLLHSTVGILSVFLILVSNATAATQPVVVYAVSHTDLPDLSGELYRFDQDGTFEQKWDIPETRFGLSLTAVDSNLFVAEFGGAINRYDLRGDFIGEFANVSTLAGTSPNVPRIESDTAGNVYVTYGGQGGNSRTSFRLGDNGNVSGEFSHPDLVFPRGIDSNADGEVFIVNSAAVGVGIRLFKFTAAGAYVDDFPIIETMNASDIAIDEIREELLIADEFDQAIQIYDISSGTPVFSDTISVPGRTSDVFVEPESGRIFGTYFKLGQSSLAYTGFEVLRDGTVVGLFDEAPISGKQFIRSIVAIPVPEPACILLLLPAVMVFANRCSRVSNSNN